MELINLKTKEISSLSPLEEKELFQKMIITIGAFDGIHLAHQTIIQKCNEIRDNNPEVQFSAVMTFDPHPDYVLKKRVNEGYITPIEERIEIFSKLGLDYLILIHFTETIATLDRKIFFDQFLKDFYGFVIGYDFRFGNKALGDPEYLLSLNANTVIIPEINYHNEKLSSTIVRSLLEQGNVQEVSKILGKPYEIKGIVTTGAHIGTTLGFPTANILLKDEYMNLHNGVYYVKVQYKNKLYQGIGNIGHNPTLNYVQNKRLEVHLFDFNLNIYGEQLTVQFIDYLRDEIKFKNKEDLVHQIKQDKEKVLKNF